MSYKIIPAPRFQRDVKFLKKKYRNIISDLDEFNTIYLLTIYAKAYKENISVGEIKEIISKYGL